MKINKTISKEDVSVFVSHHPIFQEYVTSLRSITYTIETDPFVALIETIIGQQISIKVADIMIKRFYQSIDLQHIHETDHETLKAVGLSNNKIKGVMQLVKIKQSDPDFFDELMHMSYQKIVSRLQPLYLIGPWTIDMVCLFSLDRPDIFSLHDYGIKQAISKLMDQPYNKALGEAFKTRFDQDGSLASLLCWDILNNK